MSSLIPGIETDLVARRRASRSARRAGSDPVAVRVHDELRPDGAPRPRRSPCRRRSRPASARLEQRVGAAVDGDQHRLEVADVRPHHPQVALDAGPARDDERMPVAEPRRERRELDALRRAAAPPRAGSASCSPRTPRAPRSRGARCSASALSSSAACSTRPDARHVPLRKTLPPRTVSRSPSRTWSKSSAPGASMSRTPPRTSASGPGFGKRPVWDSAHVDDDADARLGRAPPPRRGRGRVWSMIAMSSRVEPLHEVLRPAVELRACR